MKKYEKPEVEVISFDVQEDVMVGPGYGEGGSGNDF